MSAEPVLEGVAFTLAVAQAGGEVELVVELSEPVTVSTLRLPLSRAASRDFADQVLAAGGDGMQRTFPHPAMEAERG